MAQVETPGQAFPALETLFHRAVQATSVTPLRTNVVIERTDEGACQHVSTPTEQPVHSPVTEQDAGDQEESAKPRSRLIIAVDFGTTYSSVSYARLDPDADPTSLLLSPIECINNYECADGGLESRTSARGDNVPTKLLYLGPKASGSERSEPDSDSDSDPDSDCFIGDHVESILPPNPSTRQKRKRGRKPRKNASSKKISTPWARLEGVKVRWGFGVQQCQKNPHTLARYTENEAVELIKLTLGEEEDWDEDLRDKRKELAQQIEELRLKRIILGRDHLLCDYLTRLLQHTKATLKVNDLLEAAELEYVLCVPVSWSESACRTMHDAMVKAIQACRLSVLSQDLIPDLFIVSEPEAAAQYVIASLKNGDRIKRDDIFIILDAGGGTVDVTTYRVTSDGRGPLRIQGEVIKPEGALCGSSLITERYLRKTRAKLDEMDPTADSGLLDGIATALANEWDMFDKPRIDVTKPKTILSKRGGEKIYKRRTIKWTKAEVLDVFEPSLKGTIELLERQLQHAKQKHIVVNKLIVVGGFGESPSLRARIKQFLPAWENSGGTAITTIWPTHFPTSAVARGAVLRAFDKRHGPSRISRSSFGFLRHEPHGDAPEHEEAKVKPIKDLVDHDVFATNTIYWLIQAGQELPSSYQTEPLIMCHTFKPSDVEMICIEKLYVSRRSHRSHFQVHHPENLGATLLSFIEIDVSDFRKEFPLERKADSGPHTKHSNSYTRVVKFDLIINVEGKQLKYEARWPSGAESPAEVRVRKSGYVSLAPSFAPGTE